MQNFNISISICYKSNFSGLQTINICHFALSFCSPLSFSPLPPRCVSPLCLPGAVIPTQRVGVSVLRQRARALVENESEQRFHRGGLWAHQSYPKTGGSCAIYVPKNDLFFAIFYALAICHFAWPRKTGPTKSEKELFPEFPKGNLTLGGVRFPGRTQVENWHCAGFPHFLNNSGVWMGFKGHRWRNSVLG
jgi:hypothetical protein